MGLILLLNLVLMLLFYKELKLATFDPALAAALGISPVILHYGLMTVVSVTAVGAFDHVGTILVVALMIAPAATAYLLTDRLSTMLVLSVSIGVASAVSGYWVARGLDINIAAAMASMAGVSFLLALFFAPQHGYIARQIAGHRRRRRFALEMLVIHLSRHEGSPEEEQENSFSHLIEELGWTTPFAQTTLQQARNQELVQTEASKIRLTLSGRRLAEVVLSR
jgi:manganese/zinc/iron transport system permease protein